MIRLRAWVVHSCLCPYIPGLALPLSSCVVQCNRGALPLFLNSISYLDTLNLMKWVGRQTDR